MPAQALNKKTGIHANLENQDEEITLRIG